MRCFSKVRIFSVVTFLLITVYLFLIGLLVISLMQKNKFYSGSQLMAVVGGFGFLTAPIVCRIGLGFLILNANKYLKMGLLGTLAVELHSMLYLFLGFKYILLIPIILLTIYYFSAFFYFLPMLNRNQNIK